jgi:sucrose-6-phosphate hydrolase SacC (GH32 family)
VSILICFSVKAQDTLAYWGFNEGNGAVTMESISKVPFNIKTKWPAVEWVSGIKNKALRFDGYTTWTEGSLPSISLSDSISFSGWLALETYPVSTTAFWSYFDPLTSKGVLIAVDQFGRLTVSVMVNNILQSATSSFSLPHANWNNVVVNINASQGTIKAYVNASEVINQSILAGVINWPANTAKVYIGRSPDERLVQNLFPTNFLNGICDELIIRKKLLTTDQVAQQYNQYMPVPFADLTTPASRFAADFHRPAYHGLPQSGWTNETHGFIYRNGLYHLFFQKNGNGPFFSQQNWGHLTSSDLLHWKEQTVALWPLPGWESVGIWSGHLVIHNSQPTIIYTAVDGVKAGIGSAVSTDDSLITWQRNPANPLIPQAPTQYPNRDFRDPYVFQEDNSWFMIVGSGLQNPQVGTVFLYQSTDLVNWSLIGPMYEGDPMSYDSGIFWEMPVFWKFGNKYLLLVNKVPNAGSPARSFYWVGTFSGNKFVPDNPIPQNLEVINQLLSPSVNLDAEGRVTAIGIVPDELPASEQYKNGWTHLYSVPRVWTLNGDTLLQSPHPNLQQLRESQTNYTNLSVQPGSANYLSDRGFQLEISANVSRGSANQVGFFLEKDPANSEFTKIYYDYQTSEVVVDRQSSSLNTNVPKDIKREFLSLPEGQDINWHIYIDGSIVDVFINNRWAFATRIFPTSKNCNGIDLFANGGTAQVSSLQVFQLSGSSVVTAISNLPVASNGRIKACPNPFTYNTQLQVDSDKVGIIHLNIYNTKGQKIRSLLKRITQTDKLIPWDGKSDTGSVLPAGCYFVKAFLNQSTYVADTIIHLK